MRGPVACTIVANNYLAYARAFARSFLARHPEGEVHVLLADRPRPEHAYTGEPFTVTFAQDLGLPRFQHLAFGYSLLELSTALKPAFLLHLHATLACERLCYFDPDILVLGDLGDLYERLGRVDAVLTPHLTAPLDGTAVPAERDILVSGIYNLGFLGVSFTPPTLELLRWWARRLERECLRDVEHGLFVDQRWMDLAPGFLPRVEILRDPGYNVAYWNLPHRRIAGDPGAWTVNGLPLRFFHFSGYDFRRPGELSKYQNRLTMAERPDVAPLFRLYTGTVAQEGHAELQDLPYGFGRFADGTAIPEAARWALRQLDPEGRRWPEPFRGAEPGTFAAWLREPAPGTEPLPRIALLLWDLDPEVRRVFPRPWGADRLAFARWLLAESPLAPELLAGLAPALAREQVAADRANEVRHRHARTLAALLSTEGDGLDRRLTAEDLAWLRGDAGFERGRPRVSRLALAIHDRLGDVRRAFPDPLGADRKGFALWFATHGRQDYRLPNTLIGPALRSLPPRMQLWARVWWWRQAWRARQKSRAEGSSAQPERSPASPAATPAMAPRETAVDRAPGEPPAFGVDVVGWVAAPTGVGEACRGTLAALAAAGVPHTLWSLDDPPAGAAPASHADRPAAGPATALQPHGVSLFHVNADMMSSVERRLPAGALADRVARDRGAPDRGALGWGGAWRIGYWFWELAHFPLELAEGFRHVDEVWAPSRFCLEAFRPLAPVAVRWVPPCVPRGEARPADRAALGIAADEFLFFFAFDMLSVPERKNPLGLLEAFARVAAASPRPVRLLLKAQHTERETRQVEELRARARGLPVSLLTATLSRQETDGLLAACDAYVSLHRSEGLGLPLVEAMYRDKPVVATGYGGVTDFLDEETGFVVRHRLVALDRAQGPYPVGAVWAEPDLDHAAELMLRLVQDPEAARPRVEAARRRVEALYSPAAAGERFRRELAELRDRRGKF